jgi:hypothetical protein
MGTTGGEQSGLSRLLAGPEKTMRYTLLLAALLLPVSVAAQPQDPVLERWVAIYDREGKQVGVPFRVLVNARTGQTVPTWKPGMVGPDGKAVASRGAMPRLGAPTVPQAPVAARRSPVAGGDGGLVAPGSESPLLPTAVKINPGIITSGSGRAVPRR